MSRVGISYTEPVLAGSNWPSQAAYRIVCRGRFLTITEYPGDTVNLACEKCDRYGRYRKATLVKPNWPPLMLWTATTRRHLGAIH